MYNKFVRVVCVLAILTLLLLDAASVVKASGVVGNGTPASCTEAAFNAALQGGGLITFNCGTGFHTIVFTATKVINAFVTIRGDGRIALSGGNSIRLFQIDACYGLNLQTITLENGQALTGAAVLNNGGL